VVEWRIQTLHSSDTVVGWRFETLHSSDTVVRWRLQPPCIFQTMWLDGGFKPPVYSRQCN